MTDLQWRDCKDIATMLHWGLGYSQLPPYTGVRQPWATDRKLRLFAVACCRENWHLLGDVRSRRSVEVAERLADGEVIQSALDPVRTNAWLVAGGYAGTVETLAVNAAWNAAAESAAVAALITPKGQWMFARGVSLLHELFGNPFRPVVLPEACWTPTALGIAAGAYRDRDFSRLPVLADALEEAGCDEAALMDHLRQPGAHFRGCWALDQVLGRGIILNRTAAAASA